MVDVPIYDKDGLMLRNFTKADVHAFSEISKREKERYANPGITQYNDTVDAERTVQAGIESIAPDPETGRRETISLVIAERATPEIALGYIGLNPRNGRKYLGYSIDPRKQGKGYGFRAARLFLEHHFASSGDPVYADAFKGNEASLKILERLGATTVQGDWKRPLPVSGIKDPYAPMELTADKFHAAMSSSRSAENRHGKYEALKAQSSSKEETKSRPIPVSTRGLSHLTK
ncbi:MAG: GNAT family N-acetyltransferase [Alphaproteobacteria bacterium]|nr:GNAT family N-acetyltransferase [Alphaproteobacteria bacterium]